MDTLLWGIIVLISGVFISAYGSLLFRFALAFLGFAIGYSLVAWLGGGLDTALRILVGIVAGGILASSLDILVKFTLNIAGALLGLVLMLALLGFFRLAGLNLDILGVVLTIAAAGLGGFFGNRLGSIVVVLATSLAGAYLVVLGLGAIYGLGVRTDDPTALLGTSFPLVLFLTVALISGLAQYQAFSVRRRFLR